MKNNTIIYTGAMIILIILIGLFATKRIDLMPDGQRVIDELIEQERNHLKIENATLKMEIEELTREIDSSTAKIEAISEAQTEIEGRYSILKGKYRDAISNPPEGATNNELLTILSKCDSSLCLLEENIEILKNKEDEYNNSINLLHTSIVKHKKVEINLRDDIKILENQVAIEKDRSEHLLKKNKRMNRANIFWKCATGAALVGAVVIAVVGG